MTAQVLRVISTDSALFPESLLLDKIDESQGNTEGYAQKVRSKNKVYVPLTDAPIDPSVAGYIDLVPSDNVMLAQGPHGVITGLVARGLVTTANITPWPLAAPVITGAVHTAAVAPNINSIVTIAGTGFTSIAPDVTYITLRSIAGVSHTYSSVQIAALQLFDLITLTNQIKTEFNLHAANDAGAHVIHTVIDNVNAPVATPNASSLVTACTLLHDMKAAYEAHRILVLPALNVHANADGVNIVNPALVDPPVTLADAILLSNDIKAKFNAHRVQVGPAVHALNDTWNIVSAINAFQITPVAVVLSDAYFTGGPIIAGWTVHALANSKLSNTFTVT
jgi:hypothetical protein